jgi:hypothetical protein
VIRPELEQWADVATFDLPGVGAEPPVERLDRQTIIERSLLELDRRGWDSYILVADAPTLPTALRFAHARPGSVEAMALGHACLVHQMDGERPTFNREVAEAFGQLARNDWGNFVRHGLVQVTRGSIGDELAARILERVPVEIGRAVWEMNLRDSEPFGGLIREIGGPLLFAKHEGCLGHTDEGFEDAVSAFPEARAVSVPAAPSVSGEFAEALRRFCTDIERARGVPTSKP